jgi:hypothetical protein
MPKILQEEKFCDKMIRQGLARKDLQKLDIMARLTAKITLACDSLLRTLPPQVTTYFIATAILCNLELYLV